jgi:hypothetical protein
MAKQHWVPQNSRKGSHAMAHRLPLGLDIMSASTNRLRLVATGSEYPQIFVAALRKLNGDLNEFQFH